MSIVFFDLETAGVDPHHPDIQLAAVVMSDDLAEERDAFEAKIQFDEAASDPEALAINHYDPAVWKEHARPEIEVVEAFSAFLAPFRSVQMVSKRGRPYTIAQLAGHNVARFDAPRLCAMYERHGAFLPATGYQPLDTYQLALWRFWRKEGRPENLRLETLARHFGIAADGAHDALVDVRLNVEVARRLLWPERG